MWKILHVVTCRCSAGNDDLVNIPSLVRVDDREQIGSIHLERQK